MRKLTKKQIVLIVGAVVATAIFVYIVVLFCQNTVHYVNNLKMINDFYGNPAFGTEAAPSLDSMIRILKNDFIKIVISTSLITILYLSFIALAVFDFIKDLRIKHEIQPPTL